MAHRQEPGADEERVGARDLAVWTSRLGRSAARWARRRVHREDANRVLYVTLAVGAAVLVAATAATGEVYEAVVADSGIALLDRPALRLALALRSPRRDQLVTAYTGLGGGVWMPVLTVVVVLGLTAWRRRATPVLLVGVAAAGSLTMTVAGKAVVGRSRPPFSAAVPPFEDSASFPSGHSLNAVVVAGVIAYLLVRWQRRPVTRAVTIGGAVAFATTIGLSRVYLGHHWLSDVLVAWSLGAAWLAVVVVAHRLVLTVRRARRTRAGSGPGPTRSPTARRR